MIPLIAILEIGFDPFVCGSVIIYQIRKYFHHSSFSWIETWNYATCIVWWMRTFIFGKLRLILVHLYMWVKWRTKGSSTPCYALVRSTTKNDKTIRHDLLKFIKHGYAYKFKYTYETLEKVQCMAERMRRIKLGRKIKVSPIWKDGRVLEFLVLWLSLWLWNHITIDPLKKP